MKFNETKLNKAIRDAVRKAGYDEMTPIQENAIPAVLDGKDMIACAQTGTGKTAAFALPILNMLAHKTAKRPRALIMTPTRELAQQIFENFKKYGRYLSLRTACVYGGASQYKQIQKLKRGYDILIATPGRLLDFTGRELINLKDIQMLVLDEADQMLDMGFIPDIRKIESMIPEEHQTLLFSATMPEEIEKLASDLLVDPVDIRMAAQSSPAETVEQQIIFCDKDDKRLVLGDYLKRPEVKKAIVFSKTKYGAERLAKELGRQGIEARAIHGDKTQGQRRDALDRFRSGNVNVLVATDVMARGIDVPKISHVFNYDLPKEAESYIHRIGRAGRAGESGIAISLCAGDEMGLLHGVEKLLGWHIREVETEWSIQVERRSLAQKKPNGKGGKHHRPARKNDRNGDRKGGRRNDRKNNGKGNRKFDDRQKKDQKAEPVEKLSEKFAREASKGNGQEQGDQKDGTGAYRGKNKKNSKYGKHGYRIKKKPNHKGGHGKSHNKNKNHKSSQKRRKDA